MSYKYIFEIRVRPGEDAEFIHHWHNGSIPIQKNLGALGTRLHKKRGEEGVYIAIAEWASKEARSAAFANLDDPTNPLSKEYSRWKENEDFGEVTLIAEVDEIDSVFLPSVLQRWDVYEVWSNIHALQGVMLRGRIRKHTLASGITCLVENAVDKENVVRFCIGHNTNSKEVTDFIQKMWPESVVTKVLSGTPNPVLSKMQVNDESRYEIP